MFELFKSILDVPATLVETIGEIVEIAGEITENETLKEIGEAIQENSDTLAK